MIASAALIVASCLPLPNGVQAVPVQVPVRKYVVQSTVVASWYGAAFQGKKMANGERFNRNAMVAAHRTLPLNSYATITSVSTGKSVVVKIGDRGPWIAGRGLDMSEAAAKKIGMHKMGVGTVRITTYSTH